MNDLSNLFARTVNASQEVQGPAAMTDDDAADIIEALSAAGIIVTQQPITIGVSVYRGMVENIRASRPEITAFIVDMDTATEETEALAAQFDALPHEIA